MRRALTLLAMFCSLHQVAGAVSVRNYAFALNSAPAESGCAAPPPTDYFESTDANLVFWVNLAGMNTGDAVVIRWRTSAGKLDSSSDFQPVSSPGSYCFSITEPLSSNPPQAVAGFWTFDVLVNSSLALESKTRVVGPNDTSISRGGVVNTASGTTRAGMIAAGSLLSIFGNNLAPGPATAPGVPLPTTLSGVSVTINGFPAGIVDVSASEVDVLAPWAIPSDTALVQVNNGGALSNVERVRVASAAPGLFFDSSSGANQAMVYRFAADGSDGGWVSASNPLQRGDTAVFLGTGIGPIADPPADFDAGNSDSNGVLPVTVAFGGARSSSVSTSLSTGSGPYDVGVDYIWATVPAESPSGAAVPIAIQVAGAVANAVVTPVGGAVPSVAAPSLLSIGGYPPVNASSGFNPGSAISLSAAGVYPNVRTYVRFSDNTGYSVTIPAFAVYADRVISMVPPYIDQKQRKTTAGTVSCSIVQVVAGQILSSNAQTIQIAPLYGAPGPVGKFTSQYLATLAQDARRVNGGYIYKQLVNQGRTFKAVSATEFANAMTTGLQPLVGGMEEVAAGNTSSVDLGTVNGQDLSLDSGSIAIIDAMISAVLHESAKAYTNPPVVIQQGQGNADGLKSSTGRSRPQSTIIGNLLSYFGKVAQCNMPWNQISDEDTGTSSNCPSPTQAFTTVVSAAADSLREAVDSTAEDAKRFSQGVGLMLGALGGPIGVAAVAELASTASVAQAMTHAALYLNDNDDESASADAKAALKATAEYLTEKLTDSGEDATGILVGSVDEELAKQYEQISDSPTAKIAEQWIENMKDAPDTLAGPKDVSNGDGTDSLDMDVDNSPAIEITGTATGAAGNGLQNAGVEITDGDDADPPIATGATNTDGAFDLLIPIDASGNGATNNALFQITVLDESGDIVTFDGNAVNLGAGSQSLGTSSVSYDSDGDGDDDSDGSDAAPGRGATAKMIRNLHRRPTGKPLNIAGWSNSPVSRQTAAVKHPLSFSAPRIIQPIGSRR